MSGNALQLRHLGPGRAPTIALLVACSVYYLMLNVSYTYVESMIGYQGIVFEPASTMYQGIGLALVLTPCLLLGNQLRRPSDVALWILYLTVVSPFMFVAHHLVAAAPYEIACFQCYLTALFCLLAFLCKFPMRPPKRITIRRHVLFSMLIYGTAFLLLAVVYTSGFHFNLSFDTIYDRRMDARDAVTMGSLRAYSITILGQAVAPILVAFGITRKNTTAICVGIVSALCIFSLDGTKGSLFAPVFLLLLLAVIRHRRHRFATTLIAGTTGLVVLSIVLFRTIGSVSLSAYLVRRELIVPGVLLSYYWEFFSTNHHVWYSDSFLRWFIAPTYDLPMARLIGDTYFGSDQSNANANIWAAAFGQAGYAGMLFITLALGGILRFVDSLARDGDFELLAAMCGWYGIIWSNGALETSMLTNGFVVSLMILYFLRGTHTVDVLTERNNVSERTLRLAGGGCESRH